MLEMLSGYPPWHELGTDHAVIINHLSTTKKPPLVPTNLSTECNDFLKYCFEINPEHRPTCEEFLADHPFITKKYQKRGDTHSNLLDETRSLESSAGLGSLVGSIAGNGKSDHALSSIAGGPNSWNQVNSFISGQSLGGLEPRD
jgi:serine/threonine protein kinase